MYRRRGQRNADDSSHREGMHPARIWAQRQREYAALFAPELPAGHFFCARTAAAIWRLPVPAPRDDDLEIACFSPDRAVRRSGFRGREVRGHLVNVIELDGVPLSDPATTWAMLGRELSPFDLVALGDAVIQEHRIGGTSRSSRPPLAALRDLEAAVEMGRRPGIPQLRAALPLLSTKSASPPESYLRLLLNEWGAPPAELDYDIFDGDGQFIGCSEFAFPRYMLVIEYEGQHHRDQNSQWDRDIEKYRHYNQLGWEVIRVTAELLFRRREHLRYLIFEALTRRGWSGR